MRRSIEPVHRWIALGVLLGVMMPASVSALPTPPRRPADPAADDVPEAAVDDPEAVDEPNDAGREEVPDDAPKRRPGVKQIEKGKPADERLEDPEAARRAQWFGALPGFPMQGMPLPMFPRAVVPVVPPGGAGAVAGAVAGNAQAFGAHSQVIVGGVMNGIPGNGGFVVQTWVVGPDGQVIQQPPAGAPPKPGATKPKGAAARGAKPARDAAGKKAPVRRTKEKAQGPRDEAGAE